MIRPAADFRPLIEALQTLTREPGFSLEEQLAELELVLVSAELNPNPIAITELNYSLKILKEFAIISRYHAEVPADLAPFFD